VEAIETLSGAFTRLPQGHALLMGTIVGDYWERCEKLGQEPDMVLLAPIIAIFEQLQATQENSP
jgi:hypothetical protein